MPSQRHDPFLKRLYRHGLPDALRLFFPKIAEAIDWSRFDWSEKEIVVPGSKPRRLVGDLVGQAPDAEGSPLRLIIHAELQSQIHDRMGWRMLQYEAGIVLRENDPSVRTLAFVFYHCPGGGIDFEPQRFGLDFLDERLLEVRYWKVGIGDMEAEDYAESENPMAWGLAAWMKRPKTNRVELKLRLEKKILFGLEEGEYQDALLDSVETYYRLDPAEREEERRLLAAEEYEEMEELMNTYLGRIERKARREERQESQRDSLRLVLLARFGVLPESVEAALSRITKSDRLNTLIRRASIASSLDEFRADIES